MLGSPDRFHAFVVLQRFRQRGRSRVTDVVVASETARIANKEHKQKGSRDSVRPKERMCAIWKREGKGRKRRVAMKGREVGGEMI